MNDIKSHIFELISKQIYVLERTAISVHLGCGFGVSKVQKIYVQRLNANYQEISASIIGGSSGAIRLLDFKKVDIESLNFWHFVSNKGSRNQNSLKLTFLSKEFEILHWQNE